MTVEQLMNKLIEKGWRPFNKDIKEFFTLNEFTCGYRWEWTNHLRTIRAIVSKESWLWQFVCENGMVKKSRISREYFDTLWWCRITFRDENMAFWLIESSLKDESELEDFLLSNIKVWNEQL